jgi:hypothetical protein
MSLSQTQHLVRKALFLTALFLLLVLMLPACVSVRESGNQPAAEQNVVSVRFESAPGNAEVYIDGVFRGTTHVTLLLAPGAHAVEFRLAGHEPWSRELVVVAGNDTRVAARLQPEVTR